VPGKRSSGDLLVTVDVAVPSRLTPEQRELLEKLGAAMDEDPRPQITAAVQRAGVR
jgi:molecular chaperone DnaJ